LPVMTPNSQRISRIRTIVQSMDRLPSVARRRLRQSSRSRSLPRASPRDGRMSRVATNRPATPDLRHGPHVARAVALVHVAERDAARLRTGTVIADQLEFRVSAIGRANGVGHRPGREEVADETVVVPLAEARVGRIRTDDGLVVPGFWHDRDR